MSCVVFIERLTCCEDIVEVVHEIAIAEDLHRNVDVLTILEKIEDTHDIRMIDLLKDFEFLLH